MVSWVVELSSLEVRVVPSSVELSSLEVEVEVVPSCPLEVEVVPSSLEVEVVPSCPLEEAVEGVVGVSSPYLTPHANNESL